MLSRRKAGQKQGNATRGLAIVQPATQRPGLRPALGTPARGTTGAIEVSSSERSSTNGLRFSAAYVGSRVGRLASSLETPHRGQVPTVERSGARSASGPARVQLCQRFGQASVFGDKEFSQVRSSTNSGIISRQYPVVEVKQADRADHRVSHTAELSDVDGEAGQSSQRLGQARFSLGVTTVAQRTVAWKTASVECFAQVSSSTNSGFISTRYPGPESSQWAIEGYLGFL